MTDIPTIAFEAQLWSCTHRLNTKEEKYVITLHVHPAEAEQLMDTRLLGKRFQCALAAIGDDEQPVDLDKDEPAPKAMPGPHILDGYKDDPKPRRPFHSLPRSQQAGMVIKDQAFQIMASAKDTTEANGYVLSRCGVGAKSDLDWLDNKMAHDRWDALLAEYEAATNRVAEARG